VDNGALRALTLNSLRSWTRLRVRNGCSAATSTGVRHKAAWKQKPRFAERLRFRCEARSAVVTVPPGRTALLIVKVWACRPAT
jgi:hypothetical protein